jgi:exopolyphosphatase/guanosine-5'-triphosphate,3'-diphosphate pyrophosphatase
VQRQAVIDMGSNSFRLVVYSYENGSWWALSDEIREAVRVSEGLGPEGELQAEPMDRALHTAAVFAAFCESSGIDDVDAVATSAIREAPNRDELLDRIEKETGLDVRVISGEDEARYGWLAMVNSTTVEDGYGVELGGGSAQLMRISERKLKDQCSLPLGSVRLTEAFLSSGKASGKDRKAVRRHVARQLDAVDWWPQKGGRLVGIGGTIRNLAAATLKRLDTADIDVQGFVLTREALEELIEEMADKPASKRDSISGIKPDRADVILGGTIALATMMDEGGFDEMEVSEAGLREGIFFERLLRDSDPPLFDDVRRESVINLAHRYRTDDKHVGHVAKLSLELFDALAEAGVHDLGDEERELLWAACELHDIGVAIDYDDHHHHSAYLILNSGLAGYTSREQVMIAIIARYHRKGDPDADSLGDLAKKGDKNRVRLLSGIIRLAEQLERSRDQSVRSVEVSAPDGQVVLRPQIGGGDPCVPLWSARRNSDLLADAVDREVEVEGD